MVTASLPLPPPVNLRVVLSESKRIINAHLRHMLALSVLFLLPLSFSALVYQYMVRITAASLNSFSSLALLVLIVYVLVVTVFDLLAIGSISYSVFQGFYGRPVKMIPAVKSSFKSFFPLLATLVSTNFIIFGVLLILGFAVFLMTLVIKLVLPDLEFDCSSPYLQAIVTIIFTLILIKLYVNWILARVVVVAESAWGLTPLKRSESLSKGTKGVSLSLILLFSVTQSILVWMSPRGISPTDAVVLLQIVIISSLLKLYFIAATTVMYIYCKAVRGEDAWDVTKEEFVNLPLHDGKAAAYNNV